MAGSWAKRREHTGGSSGLGLGQGSGSGVRVRAKVRVRVRAQVSDCRAGRLSQQKDPSGEGWFRRSRSSCKLPGEGSEAGVARREAGGEEGGGDGGRRQVGGADDVRAALGAPAGREGGSLSRTDRGTLPA